MKPGYIIHFVIGLLIAMFIYSRFFDDSGEHQVLPIDDPLIREIYPELYEGVYTRNAGLLVPFLDHESPAVERQAWRALASTPVDSPLSYLDRALESGSSEAWMALAMHAFSGDQLRNLEKQWLAMSAQREGLSLILGRQGDRRSLDFLLDHLEQAAGSAYEYSYALAVGRLMVRHPIAISTQQQMIRQAFDSEDPQIIRAYLYGYYRGNRQSLDAATRRLLYSEWKGYGMGTRDEVDQYVAGILEGDVFYEVTMFQNSEDLLDVNTQLAVELAQLAGKVEMNDRNKLAMRILLTHENPHVAYQTLNGLEERLQEERELRSYIISEIIEQPRSDSYIWLQALKTVVTYEPQLYGKYASRLEAIAEENPYYIGSVLEIWQQQEQQDVFMERLRQQIENNHPIRQQSALTALDRYWSSLMEEKRSTQLREKVRNTVFDALESEDRGLGYATADLFENESLFSEDDFRRIHRGLETFSLPEDIEVYQRFGTLYKQRFEQRAQSVIDSLASLDYTPLNRSLQQAGWEKVTVPEGKQLEFRKPDWERLRELGQNPLWVLQTEKGTIRIEVNTLSAPATVSAIDSLTRAGTYNDIPFHRVIPNFVIQGGDIERSDGFGGPDFVIPTEASELEFSRGAVGIASAGNDTEGSQYFIMHQWKPHLNGGYTRFGQVLEGMNVVDRILPGDRLVSAYWE